MRVFDLTGQYGWVRLTGATRTDFLHRMSTNHLLGLMVGEARQTALATPIGRMIDCVLAIGQLDAVLLMTGAGNAEKVGRWLRKYIFFNDDVQIAVVGMAGARGVFEAEVAPLGGIPWPPHGWLILDPGPASDGVEDGAAFEAYRISRGWPRYPNEIGEDYIPLEAGLRAAVSFSKGCYIGQEIIARMDARGQMAKRLMRLRVEGAASAGAALFADGASAGALTSVASADALGFVRTAYATPGMVMQTASGIIVTVVGNAGL
ncbi:MAG: glycine cleavage system protein T [Thermoflexales bacterium]